MKRESEQERADRNFVELLQGARVAVTGVQVLFAFLLTVPFSPGFSRLSLADRWLFYVALVSAAVASICYIAPTAQHRVLFRQGRKETLVRRSNFYGIVGALALAVSMTTATMLVIDHLFGPTLAWGTAVVIAALALWTWFGQPALNRSDDDQDFSDGDAVPSSSSGGKAVPSSRED
ncbi:DUF6328 family protein [Nonomuraea turkmeniaca]|uniref:DUF6328 family protein n=1 Tax=Nonomuraea turkmeniaca TaxID=103838 RepID=UPI001FEB40C5|nr:DUF6328 family protein [Nonomuraea turkmeniaca]